jgi:hypothetical protein
MRAQALHIRCQRLFDRRFGNDHQQLAVVSRQCHGAFGATRDGLPVCGTGTSGTQR